MYAFAIIMWETLERSSPWMQYRFSHEILDAVVKGERPTVESRSLYSAPHNYVNLMKSAWSQDPDQRPSFDRIHLQLNDIRTELYRSQSKEKIRDSKEVTKPKTRPKPRPRPRLKSKKKAPPPPPSSRHHHGKKIAAASPIGLGFDDDEKNVSLYPV